ncbi:hypothetical protein [Aeromicrobium sp. 179-A 4D2 NHS]|uniref:hypothetical protein n=1 Tax=Aeromicrobium sp. 179-A 4D2 NHS TaxID=3142375 RepID=UPI0039A1C994
MTHSMLVRSAGSVPVDHRLRFGWFPYLAPTEHVEIIQTSNERYRYEGFLYRDGKAIARSRNNHSPGEAEAELWNLYHSMLNENPVPSLSGMTADPSTVHPGADGDCYMDLRLLTHGPAYGHYACLSCRWTELGYATWDFEYLTTVPWPDGAYCACRKRDDTGLYLFTVSDQNITWRGEGSTMEIAEQNAYIEYLEGTDV